MGNPRMNTAGKTNGSDVPIRQKYLLIIWGVVFLFIGYGVFLGSNGYDMEGLFWWMLIPTVGIIALFFYYVLRRKKEKLRYEEKKDAVAILQEQCARGDITHEQYARKNREIQDRTRDYILIRQ